MSFLSRLPHQIPFRAASAARTVEEGVVEGVFLCTSNDPVAAGTMIVEAMAQLAGSLVMTEAGFLAGIDGCEVLRPVEPGDAVLCTVRLEAAFGGTYRFSGTGLIGGVEAVRGRFYLASAVHAPS